MVTDPQSNAEEGMPEDQSVSFPRGSWATRPTKDEDGEDVLWLFPPGGVPTERQRRFDWFFFSGDCEFSHGNSWPDTSDMKEFIEEELSLGRPITFRFENPHDAAACYARLLQSGVEAATSSHGESLSCPPHR
jgi:hypothetical protein